MFHFEHQFIRPRSTNSPARDLDPVTSLDCDTGRKQANQNTDLSLFIISNQYRDVELLK